MGLATECLAVAEKKGLAQTWLMHNWSEEVPHVYDENAFLLDGGNCFKCGRSCRAPTTRPDISSGGYPCPPFSTQRSRTGGGERTGSTESHELYPTVMEGLPRYLKQRRPHCWWVEEVIGFKRSLKSLGGKSPLQVLARTAKSLGYACRCVTVDHMVFVRLSRDRIFVFGIDQECGGEEAAQWVEQRILLCIRAREQHEPANVGDVIDVHSPEEIRRREVAQVVFVILIIFPNQCLHSGMGTGVMGDW